MDPTVTEPLSDPALQALSVIIPAHNEAAYIGGCLEAVLAQDIAPPVQVIVSANACTDQTVKIALGFADRFATRGWAYEVLDRAAPGKIGALNAADAVAHRGMRVFLDADVLCDPGLLAALHRVLDVPQARYASGQLRFAKATSWVTRQFARTYARVPYITTNVPGAGLFAVNAAGRARWGEFPDLIADDGYVRLLFSPEERFEAPAPYVWPLVEGAANLMKVRRRQDEGVREIAERYPELLSNESKGAVGALGHLRLFLGDPVSYLVYVGIRLAGRLTRHGARGSWTRGR